jgi:hypothetical protein
MRSSIRQIPANDPLIIAPCGLNCSLCRAYLRERDPCPGCRGDETSKSNACLTCAIKNCAELAAGGHQFCFTCDKFPCADLLHLEGRYKDKYGVSVIANLGRIKAVGVERFVAEETTKWSCPERGVLLCMHKARCANCGYVWQAKDVK